MPVAVYATQQRTSVRTEFAAGRAVSASLLVLTAIYLLYLPLYRNYFPFGDDPAVFQASAGNPKLWFTQGFSRYFIVYPEWSTPLTDFMRPVANLIIRVEQMLFGQHYALYFASYFAAQFLVCALAVIIARHFGVKSKWLTVVGMATAINPAFIGSGLQSATYPFDVWCGLFALAALYAVLREQYGIAIALLTVSLFTKEASLYAPAAAALTVFLCTRRKLLASSMLVPLAIWGCARKFVFSGSIGGTYAMPKHNLAALLGMIMHGFLIWPTGLLREHAVRRLLLEHRLIPEDLFIGSANLILWMALLAIAIHSRRSSRDTEALPLLIWLVGALSFGVTVGQGSRFGGSIYPLEMLFFVAAIYRSASPMIRKAAGTAAALIAISFLWNAQATLRHRELPAGPSMQSLVASIGKRPAGTIYILNAPQSFSSPAAIANLAGTSAKVIVLSESSGCAAADWSNSTSIQASGAKAEIVSVLPACAQYDFDGVALPVLAHGFGARLSRGEIATYKFPDARITARGFVDPRQIASIDTGKRLEIEIFPEAREPYSILYYDWASGQYRDAAH